MHKWRQVQRCGDKLKDVYLMGFQNGSFHCWCLRIWEQGNICTYTKMGHGEEENKSVSLLIFKEIF